MFATMERTSMPNYAFPLSLRTQISPIEQWDFRCCWWWWLLVIWNSLQNIYFQNRNIQNAYAAISNGILSLIFLGEKVQTLNFIKCWWSFMNFFIFSIPTNSSNCSPNRRIYFNKFYIENITYALPSVSSDVSRSCAKPSIKTQKKTRISSNA